MAEGLTISVTNVSKLVWNRNNWHVGAGQVEGINWTDELTATPSEALQPRIAATTASIVSTHLTFIVKDALWIILGYGSTDGSFAVKLQQYFHLFTKGPQCGWCRFDNGWSTITSDTSPYTWNFGSTVVVATPTLSTEGGSVAIIIKDL